MAAGAGCAAEAAAEAAAAALLRPRLQPGTEEYEHVALHAWAALLQTAERKRTQSTDGEDNGIGWRWLGMGSSRAGDAQNSPGDRALDRVPRQHAKKRHVDESLTPDKLCVGTARGRVKTGSLVHSEKFYFFLVTK